MTFSCSTGIGRASNGLTLVRMSAMSGDLPLLVLGPSLGTSVETLWAECAGLLAGSFQIIGWELPGHGRSSTTTTPFSVAGLAEGLVEAVEELCDVTEFVYAGDSIGGAVGLSLLINHATRVSHATLVCTGARIGTAQMWADRAELVRTEGTAAVVEGSRARWFSPRFSEQSPKIVTTMLEQLRDVDGESYALTCGALARFDVREDLGAIARPITVIAGADDAATPVTDAELIANAVPGAELHVLDHVAHLGPIEAPRLVADLVAENATRPQIAPTHG